MTRRSEALILGAAALGVSVVLIGGFLAGKRLPRTITLAPVTGSVAPAEQALVSSLPPPPSVSGQPLRTQPFPAPDLAAFMRAKAVVSTPLRGPAPVVAPVPVQAMPYLAPFAIPQSIPLSEPTMMSATPTNAMAVAMMLDTGGHWAGLEPPSIMVPAVMNSGAKFVRIAPRVGQPIDPAIVPFLTQMLNAGIRLGCTIFPQFGAGLQTLLSQAQFMKSLGFFSWIMIDDALQFAQLPELVAGLKAQGWTMILSHEGKWGTPAAIVNPPTGIWAHDRHFPALAGTFDVDAINWLNYIHEKDPGSIASFALEIPKQMTGFAKLSIPLQKALLTAWAQQQNTYGYTFQYPLFWTAESLLYTSYDSIASGTYSLQVQLIRQYNS